MNFEAWMSAQFGLVETILSTYSAESALVEKYEKNTFDYVTSLDISLQRSITSYIAKHHPSHVVYGEESIPEKIDLAGNTWLIDPLDGTSNFLFEIPFYASSVAFLSEGRVTGGIVVDLVNKSVFSAYRGRGATLNGESICSTDSTSDFIALSTGFITLAAMDSPEVISDLRKIGKFRSLGSQSLHLCYVAAGYLKSCVNLEAKVWDDVAGALILCEAGGLYQSHYLDIDNVGKISTNLDLFSIADSNPKSSILENIGSLKSLYLMVHNE